MRRRNWHGADALGAGLEIMADHEPCPGVCSVCMLFGTLTPALRAAMRAQAREVERRQARPVLAQGARPQSMRHPVLLALSPDEWRSSADIARRAGVSLAAVRQAIHRARRGGVLIEGRVARIGGYRLGVAS